MEATSSAVYVQTNEADNSVIVFGRGADGQLTQMGAHATGGAGNGVPHLTSQGSVVLTRDGAHLLVTNAASDDVSVFSVAADGSLGFVGRTPAGPAPKSVTEAGGVVYVLATGTPGLTGFRLGAGGLEAIAGASHALEANADPAQVSFAPDGATLVVTERGTDSISSIPLLDDSTPGDRRTFPSSGPTPYGFAIRADGIMVVTEAFRAQKGAAAASSYTVNGTEISPATESVGNGRSEICWAVITGDGRFAFTTNFADGAVSRYSISGDGGLTLDDATAGLTEDGRPGLRDEGLTGDGRYLYAVDADSGSVYGWAVGDDGTLTAVGSTGGLPVTVAGLAAS